MRRQRYLNEALFPYQGSVSIRPRARKEGMMRRKRTQRGPVRQGQFEIGGMLM